VSSPAGGGPREGRRGETVESEWGNGWEEKEKGRGAEEGAEWTGEVEEER